MGEQRNKDMDAIRDAMRAAGIPLPEQEVVDAIIARPYTMPDNIAKMGAEAIQSLNPNGDDVADGREIAQGVINGAQAVALLHADGDELPQAKQLFGKAGGLMWGAVCGVGDLPKKSFDEIFDASKAEVEGDYHDFWTKQRAMQDPVSNFLFNGNGDREQRLPRRMMEAMPPFVIMPNGKDMCDALHDKVNELDPGNPVLAAEARGEEAIKDAMFTEVTGKSRQDFLHHDDNVAPGNTPRMFDISVTQKLR